MNVQDAVFFTPLHIASCYGHEQVNTNPVCAFKLEALTESVSPLIRLQSCC